VRILIVTPWYPTISQPVAGIFVQRDAALVAAEHQVEIAHLVDPALVTAEDLAADATAEIRVHRIPMKRTDPLSPLKAWKQLRPLIGQAEVVHSHAFQSLLPFAWHRVSCPWVHSEHWSGVANPQAFNLPGRIFFRLTSRLLRRPHVVTAVSTFLLDRVRDHRDGPTMIVPSVVPNTEAMPARHSPDALRLVSVGNLVEGKDPALAVETVAELRRRGIPATLRWVGDGPLRSSLAERIGNDSPVTLLGALDRAGVSAELEAAEVFLLPTRSETLCLSAIEAITHGRPVVIGSHGGQEDYVNRDNGILVSERTPEAYADAVQAVASAFDYLTADRVASTVKDRFTAERVQDLYQQAYRVAVRAQKENDR
jgi:glycosyltransferase involved in cell wall biosynthesis